MPYVCLAVVVYGVCYAAYIACLILDNYLEKDNG